MIRFIWQNWWRHKERLILLLVGTLIVGSGLSYLVGMAQTNRGTIINALEKRWSASYDIVVRPPGSRSVTENKHLLEPNYLSGLAGGISLKQYHKIQHIQGVQVAAPIAMIGYINYDVPLKQLHIYKNGVYRIHIKNSVDIGPKTNVTNGNFYFTQGPWSVDGKGPAYGVGSFNQILTSGTSVLLAGIDPKAEAKLVGLKGAVKHVGSSRYFENFDKATATTNPLHLTDINIPVLVSNREFVQKKETYTIERLNLPFQNAKVAAKTMEKVKANGGASYLNAIKAVNKHSYTFTAKEAHKRLVEEITGVNPKTGKPANLPLSKDQKTFQWISDKPSPLKLRPVSSPFPKRWPFAYEIKISHNKNPAFVTTPKYTYRPVKVFGRTSSEWPRIVTNYIGIYDPGKLKISQDPLTQLPMETYRPASAKLVLNAKGKPVNPPTEILPSEHPYGFLTKPPAMLTTIQAAAKILGNRPISAIRIKVAGVSNLSKTSEKKLQQVAARIRSETGLITDITLGSSPQPALTHIPAKGNQSALGWIQQPWVKLGSSFAIFRETKVGFSGVIGSVMLVAVIYVFASLLVSLLARRKEFAVLLAVGWRPRQLSKMIFLEAGLLGAFVAVVAWGILAMVLSVHQTETSALRIVLAGLFGFVIYGLGAVIPAILATRIRPLEAMRSGEISRVSRRWINIKTIFSLAFSHLLGKWQRSLLSVIAIAVPTSLLAFFLFVTFRLKGVMYTTWLGQYVALQVGPEHYVAMAVALLIAILTTAEVMWQNVSERQPEIALFKAVGWQDRSVRLLVLLEGGFSGLVSAVIGIAIAFGIIWVMYRQVPVDHVGFLLATGVIPIVIGFIGAILPAERAVRILPSQGVKGQYANLKKTEKRFRIGLGICAAVFIVGFLIMMFFTIPTVHHQAATSAHHEKVVPTSGKANLNSASDQSKASQHPRKSSGLKTFMSVKMGQPADASGSILKVDKRVNTIPVETKHYMKINHLKLPKGMKYLSLLVTFENNSGIPLRFQPVYSKLVSSAGTQKPIYYSVASGDKSWAGGNVDPGQRLDVVITYRISKKARNPRVIFNDVFFPGANQSVEVQLKK